jgi:hypothetical protein
LNVAGHRGDGHNLRAFNLNSGSPTRINKDYYDINGSPLRQSPVSKSLQNSILYPSASAEKLRFSEVRPTDTRYFDHIEKGEVAKIFKDSIFLERELESAKIELSLKPDFNLLDLFRMLDPYAKGYIQAVDLIENLIKNLQLDFVTNDDAYLFFRRYDLNNNGKITFSEFLLAITPISREYAQLITGRPEFFSRKENIPPSEYFNVDTRNEIRNLFRVMFHTEKANECLRARIAKR